jgi:hypothetical protein
VLRLIAGAETRAAKNAAHDVAQKGTKKNE